MYTFAQLSCEITTPLFKSLQWLSLTTEQSNIPYSGIQDLYSEALMQPFH